MGEGQHHEQAERACDNERHAAYAWHQAVDATGAGRGPDRHPRLLAQTQEGFLDRRFGREREAELAERSGGVDPPDSVGGGEPAGTHSVAALDRRDHGDSAHRERGGAGRAGDVDGVADVEAEQACRDPTERDLSSASASWPSKT